MERVIVYVLMGAERFSERGDWRAGVSPAGRAAGRLYSNGERSRQAEAVARRWREAQVARYDFLVETYSTERIKTLSVWSQFRDGELAFRPEPRARTPHEHMVHQCAGEDLWMRTMLAIDVALPPLPAAETRLAFLDHYARASRARIEQLAARPDAWFEETTRFFDVDRSRAWVLVRRIAHTAHHRGQLTAYLRLLGHELFSTYGPTADTGGLFQNQASVIYRYPTAETLLEAEAAGTPTLPLPGPGPKSPTERPDRAATDR
jgi:uncharacterized damage-inducible protein DinB